MLILRRKGGESLVIGDQISVTILSVDASGTVMLHQCPKRRADPAQRAPTGGLCQP